MVPSVLLQGESTAWTKLWENKSEQTRGRNWARNFPTQELLDADGGFGGFSKTLLEGKEARGWIWLSANYSHHCQHPEHAKARKTRSQLATLCLWSYNGTAGENPVGSGVETGEQPGNICWTETVGDRPQAAGVVRQEENVQEHYDGLRNPFVVFEPELMGCLRAWLRPCWSISAPMLLNLPRGSDMSTKWQWQ